MSDVFISYSKVDRPKAQGLASFLAQHSLSVFWDRTIRPGERWEDVIERELANARTVVVLWSPASVASDWVRAEAAAAADRNILVPVLLERVDLPLRFRSIQAANLTAWDSTTTTADSDALLFALRTLLAHRDAASSQALPAVSAQDHQHGAVPEPGLPARHEAATQTKPGLRGLDGRETAQDVRLVSTLADDLDSSFDSDVAAQHAATIVGKASPRKLLLSLGAGLFVVAVVTLSITHYRDIVAARAQLVAIPRGEFLMGNGSGPPEERPAHPVTLGAFELDKTEVTVAAYRMCVEDGAACSSPPKNDQAHCNWGQPGRDDHPVNCVTWYQARDFCAHAGKRLPTEEEWEYAARGEEARRFAWSDEPPSVLRGNFADRSYRKAGEAIGATDWIPMTEDDDGFPFTAPVGAFPKGDTPLGLKDMTGNVWEWNASHYCNFETRACESTYVQKGGGWANRYAGNVEASTRTGRDPAYYSAGVGFRCAK